jgi:hypothetical protein
MARRSFGDSIFPSLLQQVGVEAISRHRPYLRGDVIGPRGTLLAGTEMTALYVSPPVYLPDAFAGYRSADGTSRIFGWLIPITSAEATLIQQQGWTRFEDELCRVNPDLLDVKRASIVG